MSNGPHWDIPKMTGCIPPIFPEAHVEMRSEMVIELDSEAWLIPLQPLRLSRYWNFRYNPDRVIFEGCLSKEERQQVIELNRQRGTYGMLYNV